MYTILGFILGTILGSFAKATADRSLDGKSFWGRSFCPSCKRNLRWNDLFPILSYLILQAKCRYCRKKINIEYFLIEVILGLLIAYLFHLSGGIQSLPDGLELLFKTYFITVLAVLFLTDIKKMLIPDRIILPSLIISLIYLAIFQLVYSLVVGLGIVSFFLLLIIITRGKGMGGGDVKFGAFIGFGLGFPDGILAIMLAFLTGSLWALYLIILGKKHFGENIPFGPFLVIGSLIALFWGNWIVDWYLKLGY